MRKQKHKLELCMSPWHYIKRKRIIPFMIAAVVFILGVTSIMFGVVRSKGYAPLEPTDLCEENIGTSLYFSVQDGFSMEDGYFLAYIGEEATCVIITLPKEHKSFFTEQNMKRLV